MTELVIVDPFAPSTIKGNNHIQCSSWQSQLWRLRMLVHFLDQVLWTSVQIKEGVSYRRKHRRHKALVTQHFTHISITLWSRGCRCSCFLHWHLQGWIKNSPMSSFWKTAGLKYSISKETYKAQFFYSYMSLDVTVLKERSDKTWTPKIGKCKWYNMKAIYW